MSSSEEAEFDDGAEEEEQEDEDEGEEYTEEGGEAGDDDDDDDDDDDQDGGKDDDDDSDDDVPLSALKKKKPSAESSPSLNGKRAASKVASYAEGSDDDDSDDDDIPLAELAKKAAKPAASEKNGNKKPKAKTKAPPEKKKAKTSSKSDAAKKGKYEWASAALYGTESVKGLLIQRLLCRWWYALEWPDMSKVPDKPPENYDKMDGFPGVFVCTAGEKVGHILDMRDHDEAPTFENFRQKPASELAELLLKALNEQKKQLIEAEGSKTATEKELDQLIKWAKNVKAEKADRDAAKVLKANGFK